MWFLLDTVKIRHFGGYFGAIMLDFGYSSLVAGRLFLVTGFWLLVAGSWSPITAVSSL